MTTRLRTEDLGRLRSQISDVVSKIVGSDTRVEVGWLDDSTDIGEVLVEIVLADPGEGQSWDRGLTDAIRTAVREATADVLPSVVATTRLVSTDEDG